LIFDFVEKPMEKDFQIRRAHQGDIKDIGRLWVELADVHAKLDPLFKRSAKGRESFENFVLSKMRGADHLVLIAFSNNGEAIGFCQAGVSEYADVFEQRSCGFIFDMYVSTECRRKGVGAALFLTTKEWFDEKNITRIELNLFSHNTASSAFWESLGFRTFMERRRLESGKAE